MSRTTFDNAGFLKALMEAAADGIIIIDHRASILGFNRSAQRIFGYTESEVIGRNVSLLMPEPDRSRHDGYLTAYRDTGKAAIIGIGREVRGLRKDGTEFPLRLSVGESRRGEEVHFVGIVHDLSEERETERKLRELEQGVIHADRLVTLGELTAGIAHEINQPLTAIAAYAEAGEQLAERDRESSEAEMKHVCGRIAEQSRRAAAVVDRLRGLARSGATRKARHDVRNILQNVMLLIDYELKRTKIAVVIQDRADLPLVFVDEIQVQQVLTNLLKNALDAIGESRRSGGEVRIAFALRPAELDISVADNGPGVTAANEAQLFEPFFTSKPQGVGLGLAICKTIAAAHGTVCIVDDDEAIRDALRLLLFAQRIPVRCYASAQAFLDDGRFEDIACLLLDIRMPGMDGTELFHRLRQQAVPYPVIFVTGHGDIPLAVSAIKQGAFDFLTKPFDEGELLSRVRAAISSYHLQRDSLAQKSDVHRRAASCTPREREVMRLMGKGLSNKAIADALLISARTVEIHRAHVLEKMQADSLPALVRMIAVLETGDSAK